MQSSFLAKTVTKSTAPGGLASAMSNSAIITRCVFLTRGALGLYAAADLHVHGDMAVLYSG